MVFVDGTNFLISLFKRYELKLRADNPPLEILSLTRGIIGETLLFGPFHQECLAIRYYWFASYQGNEEIGDKIYSTLRQVGFEPVLFKKDRDKTEKGVDIELTKEMLVNAFNNNYDVGYLFAGDEDYVNLVKEVKRYGVIIVGSFFDQGLSPKLKVTFDYFHPINVGEGQNKTLMEMQKRQGKRREQI